MRTFAVACFSTLFLVAAAEAAKSPAWVRGADPAYPDATYLKGVGVGNDLEAARSNARAEISKIFRARVEQTASESQSESSAARGKKRGPVESAQQTEMSTRVSTDGLLEGVEIASTWFDKKAKKHYALAVLNKPKARAALGLQIAEKEETMAAVVAQGDKASSPIESARAYARALRASRERDELLPRRRVVDPAPIPDLSGLSTADVERRLADSSSRILFSVEAEGGARLRETVTEKLTAMGFRVLESTYTRPAIEGPLLSLRCKLTVEPFDRGNATWKFYRWTGSFELRDAAGKVLASAAPSASEGHMMEETARLKTVTAGEQGLALEAQKQISQYIFGR